MIEPAAPALAAADQGAVSDTAIPRIERIADSPGAPRFGIGINTGLVLVGNVGSPDLGNFTAIGDTTNLRLTQACEAGAGSAVARRRPPPRRRGRRASVLIGDERFARIARWWF